MTVRVAVINRVFFCSTNLHRPHTKEVALFPNPLSCPELNQQNKTKKNACFRIRSIEKYLKSNERCMMRQENGDRWSHERCFKIKMMNFQIMFIISLLIFCFLLTPEVDGNQDAKRLYESLFREYNVLIRPVENSSDFITVKLGLKLIKIIELVSFTTLSVPLELSYFNYLN